MDNIENNNLINKNNFKLNELSNDESLKSSYATVSTEENKNSSNSNSDSDSDSNSDNDNIPENNENLKNILEDENTTIVKKKTLQEVMDESKIKTEKELIKLGKQINEEENKKKEFELKIIKNKEILEKYKEQDCINIVDDLIKNKKYIELKELVDVSFSHEKMINEILIEKDKKIKKLDTQLDDSIQDNKDLMQENNDLEEREDNYWKPRVEKLRNKLIERRKFINYFYAVYLLSVIHTFLLTKYGFKAYFNFWIQLFYIIYKIIYFTIFLLPNTYKLITNPDSYTYLSNLIVSKLNLIFLVVWNFTIYLIKKFHLTLGLIISTLILIKVINKFFFSK